MNIELKEITVRDLTNGYKDNAEDGVIGYNGQLDIRPPYQREFVYGDKERNAVINTLQKDFPLNVMLYAILGRPTVLTKTTIPKDKILTLKSKKRTT